MMKKIVCENCSLYVSNRRTKGRRSPRCAIEWTSFLVPSSAWAIFPDQLLIFFFSFLKSRHLGFHVLSTITESMPNHVALYVNNGSVYLHLRSYHFRSMIIAQYCKGESSGILKFNYFCNRALVVQRSNMEVQKWRSKNGEIFSVQSQVCSRRMKFFLSKCGYILAISQ